MKTRPPGGGRRLPTVTENEAFAALRGGACWPTTAVRGGRRRLTVQLVERVRRRCTGLGAGQRVFTDTPRPGSYGDDTFRPTRLGWAGGDAPGTVTVNPDCEQVALVAGGGRRRLRGLQRGRQAGLRGGEHDANSHRRVPEPGQLRVRPEARRGVGSGPTAWSRATSTRTASWTSCGGRRERANGARSAGNGDWDVYCRAGADTGTARKQSWRRRSPRAGNLDLAVANRGNTVTVFEGNGTAPSEAEQPVSVGR